MRRHELSEAEWRRLRPFLPPLMGRPSSIPTRQFLNAVIWKVKTGIPWRDIPRRYGKWKVIYNRFYRWAKAGYFSKIFTAIQIEVDDEWNMIDSSIVRVHQHGSGGKGGRKNMLWDVLEEVLRQKFTHELMH
jgi:transposase